jgi:hypothetical protein
LQPNFLSAYYHIDFPSIFLLWSSLEHFEIYNRKTSLNNRCTLELLYWLAGQTWIKQTAQNDIILFRKKSEGAVKKSY